MSWLGLLLAFTLTSDAREDPPPARTALATDAWFAWPRWPRC